MPNFFNKYPYTDFHELNLDWIIETVKNTVAEWATTLEEWHNTEEEWQQLYDYVHDYFDNLDVQEEINNKINEMILDGTFITIATPVINSTTTSTVTAWLDAHVDPVGSAVIVDDTLSITGAAADAKETGDHIRNLENHMNMVTDFSNNQSGNQAYKNYLFEAEEIKYNCYWNGSAFVTSTQLFVARVYMKNGVTYYFENPAYNVSDSDGNILATNPVASFTPTANDTYIISMSNGTAPGDDSPCIIATNSNTINSTPFFTPSFRPDRMMQTTGSSTRYPMSQKAVTDAIQNVAGSDVLLGKKWYALGDSFTHGDFTGVTDYQFTDQPYQGENKVYPFWIGRRAGMTVVNMAVNGATLATYSGGATKISDGLYQSVGADADYITLKVGINDCNHSIPIGTASDANNDTFCGAWNVVLSWLITNRPFAKIGIIVSNGISNSAYATATIAMANKYGIPYLNEYNGEQVPVVYKSGRTDVDASILAARDSAFEVSNTNPHPNVDAHEYESIFIQEWLKTL